MPDRAFVVGLSGIPGSGKTTLTQLLLRHFSQAQVVYYDQFQTIVNMTHVQVREWFARGGDPNEFALSELIAELERKIHIRRAGQRRPVVFFETPFGRFHRTTGAFIDFLIWIDTPLDLALARATLAFLALAQRDQAPNAASDFLQWQRQYLLNYPHIRPMYLAQVEKLSASANLVLDGTRSAEESVELMRRALIEQGVEP